MPKRPVRRCANGHRVPSKDRHGRHVRVADPCPICVAQAEEATREQRNREALERQREEWERANPTPAYLVTLVVSTGRRIVHAIPPGLRKPQSRRRPLSKRRRAMV